MGGEPAIGDRGSLMHAPDQRPSRNASAVAIPTSGCRRRWTRRAAASCTSAPRGRGAAGIRGPARARAAPSRTTSSPTWTPTWNATRSRSTRHGGQVHWAGTAEEARAHHPRRSAARPARRPSPRASPWSARRSASTTPWRPPAIEAVETDLGEYIIQLAKRAAQPHHRPGRAQDPRAGGRPVRGAPPPARLHAAPDRGQRDGRRGARSAARASYFSADVGITGGNFLIAETGSSDHRHQRGQRRPDATLARVHIVTSRHRARGAHAGRRHRPSCACWRAAPPARRPRPTPPVSTGPRRADDLDGPQEYHVVLLDNGRSKMLAGAVPRDAALHPLRRLPEPLPGLRRRSAGTPTAGSIPARWARC